MKTFLARKTGERLDLFLKDLAGLSRKEIKRQIDAGRVSVNGRKVVIASWELQKKDQITLQDEKDNTAAPASVKNYFLKVIFEDETLLVVEKETGIACERSPLDYKPSLPEIVYEYLKRAHPTHTHPFVLPIHRLDRGTSGVMVYGKSKAAEGLLNDFKQHSIHRTYVALVEGVMKTNIGAIRASLTKTPSAKGKKMHIATDDKGKSAVTEYEVIQKHAGQTLVRLNLKTGRTHQIRAHLAHIGHPVVGDEMYGKKQKDRSSGRLALHATELGFIHPVTHKKVLFRSKLPKTFQKKIDSSIAKTVGMKKV